MSAHTQHSQNDKNTEIETKLVADGLEILEEGNLHGDKTVLRLNYSGHYTDPHMTRWCGATYTHCTNVNSWFDTHELCDCTTFATSCDFIII